MVTGPLTRSRWIAVAVLSATFLAGGMLGVATTRLLDREPEATPRRDRSEAERRDRGPRPSIFDQMDLTAEQRAIVDSAIEKRTREMKAFWKDHNPEVVAIVDSARAEIIRVLTPEQRQQYEEFLTRRGRDHGGPGGPGGRDEAPRNWGPGRGEFEGPPRPERGDTTRRPISYQEPQYL